MVIKKPYAFLIKHFRLIHGLLFAMLIYLTVKSVEIYSFFNGYATNHTYLNEANLASNYVTPLMYLLCGLSILVFFVIFFILNIKEKSNRIYLAGILYYIILLVYFIYFFTIFKSLESGTLDVESVRFYRDVSLIVLLPQIVFLFIIFGRTLGFNLKQFEFKKDLEELEIDVTDNEEVELTLGNDTYKIARFFRKFLRLTKYFLIENRLFVIIVSSIFILGMSLFVYSKISVYQETYNAGDIVYSGNFSYDVKDSYITEANTNNTIETYLLVNVEITNSSKEKYDLNRDLFKLKEGNTLLIPEFGMANKFDDIGDTYEPGYIYGNKTMNTFVVFRINKKDIEKEYIFRIKSIGVDKRGNQYYYKDYIIKPYNLNDIKDKGTFKLGDTINFKDTLLKNTTLTINEVDIADRFQEPYNYSLNGKIVKGIYNIQPSLVNKGSTTLLKLKVNMVLDNTITNNKLKEPAYLLEHYGVLKYRYQGEYKNAKIVKNKNEYNKQLYSYLEIPKEIEDANKIDLVITVRGQKYTINLK